MIAHALRRRVFPAGLVMSIVWMFVFGLYLPWANAQSAGAVQGTADLTTAVMQVAKQTIPAVVHIEVTERQEVVNPLAPFENDPFLQYFFNVPRMPRKSKREVTGLGTGMLMDARGYILTNHHVAGGAIKIDR